MSLLSSPTRTTTGGGSQPDLSKMNPDQMDQQITFRKRKQPDDHCDCKKEISNLRTEISNISSLLQNFISCHEQNTDTLREGFTDIKNEIKEINSTHEKTVASIQDLKVHINDVKSTISNLASKQGHLESQITELDKKLVLGEGEVFAIKAELDKIKSTLPSTSSPTNMSRMISNEEILREIQERNNRQRNIIVVGVPEQKTKDNKERLTRDEAEVMRILTNATTEYSIPQPTNIFRLGKYTPTKNRRMKICFENNDIPLRLLRTKLNLPDGIRIYSDQTPAQQKLMRNLKDELTKRHEDGEKDLIIKYVKGIPQITKPESKN